MSYNIRILHSGSKTQVKGDSRKFGLWDPCVDVVLRAPVRAWFWFPVGDFPGKTGLLYGPYQY